MPSTCPICADRKFRTTFDELIAAGGELTAARKLVDNELEIPQKVSTYRIKLHAIQHSGVEPDRIHESFLKTVRRDPAQVKAEKIEREARGAVVESYLDEIASIDLDGILQELGLNRNPNSLGDVLTIAQELSVSLNLLAGVIAVDRLRKFAKDPEGRRYPSVELKGAESTASMMATAFGFQQAVSLQTAVDTLEKAGFKVIDEASNNQRSLPQGSD